MDGLVFGHLLEDPMSAIYGLHGLILSEPFSQERTFISLLVIVK